MPKKGKNNQPLTLEDLVKYNEEVLFPALEARFVTKDEFSGFKDEFSGFKDQTMTHFDSILKKLDILIEENDVADYQWEKNKKLLMFLISKLKDNKILSDRDIAAIKAMEVF